MNEVAAHRCLGAAEEMLGGTSPLGATAVAAGWWPKAVACLIRIGLESGVDAFWSRRAEAVVAGSWRTKFLLLRGHASPDTARRAHLAWARLSGVIHYRCCDRSLTAGELRHLHTEVTDVLAHLMTHGDRAEKH